MRNILRCLIPTREALVLVAFFFSFFLFSFFFFLFFLSPNMRRDTPSRESPLIFLS